MPIEVLDPTYGDDTNEFALAGRPVSLEGATVGVISNGKQGTRPFFDALERELLERQTARGIYRQRVRSGAQNLARHSDEALRPDPVSACAHGS